MNINITVTEKNWCNLLARDIDEANRLYGSISDEELIKYISDIVRLEEVEERPFYNNIEDMKEYVFKEVRRRENENRIRK